MSKDWFDEIYEYLLFSVSIDMNLLWCPKNGKARLESSKQSG